MADDDETDAEYLEALLALTQGLRLSKGPKWTQEYMADHLGIPLWRYKKYERRSPMPHNLIVRFCNTVDVSVEDYLSLKAKPIVKAKPRHARPRNIAKTKII